MRRNLWCASVLALIAIGLGGNQLRGYEKVCALPGTPPMSMMSTCSSCHPVGNRTVTIPMTTTTYTTECVTVGYLAYSFCCPNGYFVPCYTQQQQVPHTTTTNYSYSKPYYGKCDAMPMNKKCWVSSAYTNLTCNIDATPCGAGTYYDDFSCSTQLGAGNVPAGAPGACTGTYDKGTSGAGVGTRPARITQSGHTFTRRMTPTLRPRHRPIVFRRAC